ncbi:hypothetical protein Bb109J_c1491 [Bdellovibrio bacteriovorus]|uniref:hypothetical protein n=1 Tax=Bdellovibrio bacteriovorus TaxID=959 RepID=UPI00045BF591|nr:hypothetical protein [Bdellovibrio bacteriovorus]AHZ84186.1 hypothetical protein EP01_04420 [Bdellovibrio bacteriovorus]BEV68071.1 hypothetical protein Bb109J_c1491 [Bdellovibrio bacteriovorus]
MQESTASIQDQVSQDIGRFLQRHKDPRKGLLQLSAKTRIHTKTLRRLVLKEHNPTYQTLYKLYSCLMGTADLGQMLNAAPALIQEKLRRTDPQLKSSPLHKYNVSIEQELIKDPCFSELYVLADTRPFDLKFVKSRFGEYGLDVLQKMLQLNVLRLLENGRYALGSNRSTFSAVAIKAVGLRLTEKYSKPARTDENYANYMNLFFESINEATYRKWLDIDVQAFQDKMRLLEDPSSRGSLPIFMFNVIDTLQEPS